MKNVIASTEDFLSTTCAQICSVNEANVEVDSDIVKLGILNFSVEVSTPPRGSTLARACLFVRNDVKYKRRTDLEPPGLAIVVVELLLPKEKVLVASFYRERSIPGHPDSDKPANQVGRFEAFCDWLLPLSKKKQSHDI